MTKDIWIREYINQPKNSDDSPLFFIKTNDESYGIIIEQKNHWGSIVGYGTFRPEKGFAKDRKLTKDEYIKYKLLGIL